jgi:hypothetical protein
MPTEELTPQNNDNIERVTLFMDTHSILDGNGEVTRLSAEVLRQFERIAGRTSIRNDVSVYNYGTNGYENDNEYSDVENSDDTKLVNTVNNGELPKSECYRISGKWYSKNDESITVCYFSKKPILKKHCITLVSEYNPLTGAPDSFIRCEDLEPRIIRNIYKEVIITVVDSNGAFYNSLYSKVNKEFYTECLDTFYFIHNDCKTILPITVKKDKTVFRKASNTFNSGEYGLSLNESFKMGVKSPTFTKTEGKKYTFGVELETITGKLPHWADLELNYEAVRDGSLKHEDDGKEYGGEYITGVLIGDTGLMQLSKLCTYLTKYCKVNKKCGMHLHLAGLPFNTENIVYFYKLAMMLEKEIFSMLPLSRRKNEYCRELKKFSLGFTEEIYNNPLEYKELLENYYLSIFKYISHIKDTPDESCNKKTQHPMGNKCGYRHETARYCWLNFVPTLFDTRSNGVRTIEIRNHPGTTNFKKIKNYLLIFMGMAWYVENKKKVIGLSNTITLEQVIKEAYPKNYKSILDYIELRKLKFSVSGEEAKDVELQDYNEIIDTQKLTIKDL